MAVAALALFATGCDTEIDGGDGGGDHAKPVTLVVSEVWVADHQADSGGEEGEGCDRQRPPSWSDVRPVRHQSPPGTGAVNTSSPPNVASCQTSCRPEIDGKPCWAGAGCRS